MTTEGSGGDGRPARSWFEDAGRLVNGPSSMPAVMETTDGKWRVEVYQWPLTQTYAYRLVHGETTVDGLPLAEVQRRLREDGYELADLVEVAS
jgi:hypothetical protein